MKHQYQRRVQFADTDAGGVVHFSRILCYVEEAEHELLGELGIPLLGEGGWPRVGVKCDYKAPLRVGETATVEMSVAELGKSSVRWVFAVSSEGKSVAKGEVSTVRIDNAGKPEALCQEWRNKLDAYCAE